MSDDEQRIKRARAHTHFLPNVKQEDCGMCVLLRALDAAERERDVNAMSSKAYYRDWQKANARAAELEREAEATDATHLRRIHMLQDDRIGLETKLAAARAERDEARAKVAELAGRYNGALIALDRAENDPRLAIGQACIDWCADTQTCHLCAYSDDDRGAPVHDEDCPLAALDAAGGPR